MVEGDAVDRRPGEAGVEDGADLGGDGDAGAVAPPVERLDAELVAGGQQSALWRVPQHEGEDPVQLAHELDPALLVGVDDHLAV